MFLGSRFHNLMVDGKKENLKLSTFVSNCLKYPLRRDGGMGVRQLSGMDTK